jgi:1-deoxy-D-xylulose-5-phosphate reductoisomerase
MVFANGIFMRVLHPLSTPVMPDGGDVCILGSTGSVGVSTLQVLDKITDRPFRIKSLVCGKNIDLLITQALHYKPSYVACRDENAYKTLKEALPHTKIHVGEHGILEVCDQRADYVMAAISGKAGLLPTVTAAKQGTVIALANKECVVVGGQAFLQEINKNGATIFPVDSEHSALYHLKATRNRIEKYIITASGGPFRDKSIADLQTVSVSDALKHPNWSMGAKISIDSATMANKGLELIEAKILFDLKNTQIDAVIHKQSIVHGMVTFADGAVTLYASNPCMQLSIGASLNYGAVNRFNFVEPIDFSQAFSWDFEPINSEKYPCFLLAKRAMNGHSGLPCVFNAVNEVAVEAFLKQNIAFNDIPIIIEQTIEYFDTQEMKNKMDNQNLTFYVETHHHAETLAHDAVASLVRNKKAKL